ncbi:hypothetical protein BJ322DRAFT_524566 [Thelephora terrestris]|uniref:Uncharacterized protein n=1 Tax=Thelephora terrestris TaxID=56493 RepID=A0A9P6HK97_9AGAM|nr:hypothetical protein BJ322DRAFT_524566 [Thelephora terrestris]
MRCTPATIHEAFIASFLFVSSWANPKLWTQTRLSMITRMKSDVIVPSVGRHMRQFVCGLTTDDKDSVLGCHPEKYTRRFKPELGQTTLLSACGKAMGLRGRIAVSAFTYETWLPGHWRSVRSSF